MDDRKPIPGPLLKQIQNPDDLSKLSLDELPDLCHDLREFIIDAISVYGGHFGASLGVVELTAALHYAYQTPKDKIIWDVGHQAYGHKILTERRDNFHTNRKYKGISGFPKKSESIYDAFGVGHSSTSISAGLGMAVASELLKDNEHVVAVIGDGAMTGGIAFEAMNNAGVMKSNLLVILNDNNMSIDPNVGALNEYLVDITSSQTFIKLRNELWDSLGHFKKAGDKMRKMASRLEKALVSALTPGGLFKAFGFKYYGPVDGHDVIGLVKTLNDLKQIPGPKLLHAVTIKGKGFAPAEREQVKWHASSLPFNKITGESLVKGVKSVKSVKPLLYQDVFGETIVDLAKRDERVVAVTAAMPSGTGLLKMMETIPNRAFDVGIAEQHAVTFCAGMATKGFKPFVAIYSTFLQRAYDQVIHDVAIQKLPVVFCMDRAGLAGADGPTHHGLYDIAYLRTVPNMVVSAPMTGEELRNMMFTALQYDDGAFAIRYPRGNSELTQLSDQYHLLEIGKGEILTEGDDIVIMSYGTHGLEAVKAVNELETLGISVGHYNMRFVKPLDKALIDHALDHYSLIITLEDGAKMGGFGSAVAEYVVSKSKRTIIDIMGIPDKVVEHGTQQELYKEIGIDSTSIVNKVKSYSSIGLIK